MHPRPAHHRAFSLAELLIVISIMAVMMAVSVGAFVRGSRVNKIAAAESMLADFIRQARHTARSSGRTAMVELEQEDVGGGTYRVRVQGVTRTPLWHACEGWAKPRGDSALVIPGRTGFGLACWSGPAGSEGAFDKDQDGNLATDDPQFNERQVPAVIGDPATLDGTLLEREKRLARGRDSDPPALLVSLWALVPAIQDLPPAIEVIPLIQVAVDDPAEDSASPQGVLDNNKQIFGNVGRSKIGILLLRSELDQAAGRSDVAKVRGDAVSKPAVFPSWEVLGWVNDASQTRHEVSSVSEAPTDQTRDEIAVTSGVLLANGSDVTLTVDPSGLDAAGPYAGGRWTHLALLFDRNRLVLYRDGRRIAEKALSTVPALYPGPGRASDSERVILGYAKIADYASGTARIPPVGTIVDDVLIERIGSDSIGSLPGGMGLADNGTVLAGKDRIRIVCHPDGRVELLRASTGAKLSTFSVFTGPDSSPEDVAAFTVQTDGTVSSVLQPKAGN